MWIVSLTVVFLAVVLAVLSDSVHVAVGSEGDNSDKIAAKMAQIDEQTKEMAEEAFLIGTCLNSSDKMKILAHPDTNVAILGTEIPTCQGNDDDVMSAREMLSDKK